MRNEVFVLAEGFQLCIMHGLMNDSGAIQRQGFVEPFVSLGFMLGQKIAAGYIVTDLHIVFFHFLHLQKITPSLLLALMSRPRWCLRAAGAGIPRIGHLSDRPEFGKRLLEQAAYLNGQMDANFTWEDVKRLRDR